jgi:hypothetical protein
VQGELTPAIQQGGDRSPPSKECNMSQDSNPLAHLRTEILWLHVGLSAQLEATAIEAWHQRLQAHLKMHGLVAAISPARIAVLPHNRPLAYADRGVVLGWMLAQPEVVFVRMVSRSMVAPDDLDTWLSGGRA